MAKKYQHYENTREHTLQPPLTLEGHPFYGFQMDEEQKQFRDAIWNPEKLIVFCNAKAGSGKTTMAVATANLLVQYGRYESIAYIVSPYGEGKQGFLPGTIEEKSEVYMTPLTQALMKCNVNPIVAVQNNSALSQKMGSAYITAMTQTYLRGVTLENTVVIIDEAQNYTKEELKKTLTRMSDSCKVVVIGHDQQCDLKAYENNNGFVAYLEHFRKDDRCAVCSLTKNYRGWISQYADELGGENDATS